MKALDAYVIVNTSDSQGRQEVQDALRFQERLANGTLFSTPSKKGHGEDPCTPSSLATTWILGEQPGVLTEDFAGWGIGVCGFEISSFSILEFLWVWISFQDLPANNGTAVAVAAETNKPDLEEKTYAEGLLSWFAENHTKKKLNFSHRAPNIS